MQIAVMGDEDTAMCVFNQMVMRFHCVARCASIPTPAPATFFRRSSIPPPVSPTTTQPPRTKVFNALPHLRLFFYATSPTAIPRRGPRRCVLTCTCVRAGICIDRPTWWARHVTGGTVDSYPDPCTVLRLSRFRAQIVIARCGLQDSPSSQTL